MKNQVLVLIIAHFDHKNKHMCKYHKTNSKDVYFKILHNCETQWQFKAIQSGILTTDAGLYPITWAILSSILLDTHNN